MSKYTLIPLGQDSIKLTPAIIEFPSYESILSDAERVSKQVMTVEVTEDNTKESKKLLAKLRKEVDRLNRGRIETKKAVLKPYEVLEQQVKTINAVVDEAEQHLDRQIKALQEKEREAKEVKVRELFRQRIIAYDFEHLISEDNFIFQHYLNSSVSMNQVEKEMLAQLEKVHEEIEAIQSMDMSEEILIEYAGSLNLPLAIQAVKQRQAQKEKVQEMMKEIEPERVDEAIFIVRGKVEITLTEMLLQEHAIPYTKTN